MSDLILHHYRMSPFAHKVRLMLGFKGLAWRSVNIPVVMPKPDVIALTGGYRKTPVLQVGADVYCDTALIARVLEAHQPTPTLYPASAPLAVPLAQWADFTLFWHAVVWALQPAGAPHIFGSVPPEVMKSFGADRASFAGGMRRPTLADATVQLQAHLTALDAQLGAAGARRAAGGGEADQADLAALDGELPNDGRWLLGDAPSVADFAVAHALWFVRNAGPMAEILAPHTALSAWLDRVLAFGEGTASKLDSGEAVAIAAAATRHAPCTVQPGLGFDEGAAVTVAATDYGVDPSAGTLVGLSADEVVVRRHDDRAGTVHVHFPRQGFQIRKADA